MVASAATAALALTVVHAAAIPARSLAATPGAPPAWALTWAVLGIAAAFALVHLAAWQRRRLAWLGGAIAAVAAVTLAVLHPGGPAVAAVTGAIGFLQTQASLRLSRRLSPSLAGLFRRRPVVTVLWGVLAVLMLVQVGRLSTYMADPSTDWWLTTRQEWWAKHMCMPAYIEAADLNRQGAANVYADEHYLALRRAAKPRLTVVNMEAFVGDPFQYPPPFLLLPRLALMLTNDYLTLRTFWFAIQLVGFACVAFWLAAWVNGSAGRTAAFLFPAVLLSVPVLQSLQYGQFHLAALVLALGGMLAVAKGRDALGGTLIAAATLAKIFPGLLLVVLVVQRRWRAIGWTITSAAGISLVALLVIGPQPFRAFGEYQLPRVATGAAFDFAGEYPELRETVIADNLSPAALVSRLHEFGAAWATPRLGTAVMSLYALFVLAAAVLAGRRSNSRREAACAWLALLNLAALQSPGAFADYVGAGSVWLLVWYPDVFRGSLRGAAWLLAGWIFFALSPGIPPVPASMPVPVTMALTGIGGMLLIGFNAWALVRRVPAPAVQRS